MFILPAESEKKPHLNFSKMQLSVGYCAPYKISCDR